MRSFSHALSHDLRAPIRHIEGYAEVLNGMPPEEVGDYLAKIESEAKELSSMVDGLNALCRISSYELIKDKVSLSELIAKVEADCRESEWQDVSGEVKVNVGGMAFGDWRLLKIVFQNLLQNAMKYSAKEEHPCVQVRSVPTDDPQETVVAISDNGIGFNTKYASNLFQPFRRLHNKNEYKGEGIGLATVSRILKRHSGRIWFESEKDKSTTFFISLEKWTGQAPVAEGPEDDEDE